MFIHNSYNQVIYEDFISTEIINSDKLYDDFYSSIYDELFMAKYKNKFEIFEIKTNMIGDKNKDNIRILDIGCGTGHHVELLSEDYNVTGLDKSKHMLRIAKKRNKKARLIKGDALNKEMFPISYYTNIICMYFTIYYIKDKRKLFNNMNYWLKKNGMLCVHVVNSKKFDPILDKASPFPGFSLQKYSKKRITKSVLHFNNFIYKANYITSDNNMANFEEIFEFKKKKKIRKQNHTLYMVSINKLISIASDSGFKLVGRTDELSVGYEYNYLLYFKKRK